MCGAVTLVAFSVTFFLGGNVFCSKADARSATSDRKNRAHFHPSTKSENDTMLLCLDFFFVLQALAAFVVVGYFFSFTVDDIRITRSRNRSSFRHSLS